MKEEVLLSDATIPELQHRLREMLNKQREVNESEFLPQFKSEYNGTYWKMDNGYNPTDRWPLYVYLEDVTGLYENNGEWLPMACGWSMQMNNNGTITIETADPLIFAANYPTSVTSEEFNNHKLELLNKILLLKG